MKVVLAVVAVLLAAFIFAVSGDAHLVRTPDHPNRSPLENRLAQQSENLYHARYVCRNGGGQHKRWACHAAKGWLFREWRETKEKLSPSPWWVSKQIEVAEILGRAAARDPEIEDPWPNCPDPYDGRGHSWIDTLACENRAYYERYGNTPEAWKDSPGFFRCGLQFHPMHEDTYGRLCP